MKPLEISGQAVMEGIMMKHGSEYAIAVRKADHSIEVKKSKYYSVSEKLLFLKVPFLRGIVYFLESFYLGIKTLIYSVSFFEQEKTKQKEEWEDWISTGTGKRFTGDKKKKPYLFRNKVLALLKNIVIFLMILCLLGMTATILVLLPLFLSEQLMGLEISMEKTVLEGSLRLIIFLLYLVVISKVEEVRRVFMYHGAEHKTINCINNGWELNIENVRKQTKNHSCCETSFFFLVIICSLIVDIFIKTEIWQQKAVFWLVLIFVISAIVYEWIRLTGTRKGVIAKILNRPEIWIQNLVTREPDDDMIEVAIQCMEAVCDWNMDLFRPLESNHVPNHDYDNHDHDIEETENDIDVREETAATRTLSVITKERLQKAIADYKNQEQEEISDLEEEKTEFLEKNMNSGLMSNGEEDDAILRALDKFFGE